VSFFWDLSTFEDENAYVVSKRHGPFTHWRRMTSQKKWMHS